MEYLEAALLAVVGLIHILPLMGVLSRTRVVQLYDVAIDEANLSILLRHRAVLFGILGVFLLCASVRPQMHVVALAAGAVSVISFLAISWSEGGYNAAIRRVVVADWIAVVCILLASILHLFCHL